MILHFWHHFAPRFQGYLINTQPFCKLQWCSEKHRNKILDRTGIVKDGAANNYAVGNDDCTLQKAVRGVISKHCIEKAKQWQSWDLGEIKIRRSGVVPPSQINGPFAKYQLSDGSPLVSIDENVKFPLNEIF
jgi:hypothetical protein